MSIWKLPLYSPVYKRMHFIVQSKRKILHLKQYLHASPKRAGAWPWLGAWVCPGFHAHAYEIQQCTVHMPKVTRVLQSLGAFVPRLFPTFQLELVLRPFSPERFCEYVHYHMLCSWFHILLVKQQSIYIMKLEARSLSAATDNL